MCIVIFYYVIICSQSYTTVDLISGFNDFHYTYLFPLGGGKAGNREKHAALSLATNFPSEAAAHSPCVVGREQPSWNPSSLLSQRFLFPLFSVGFPVFCIPCFSPAPSVWVDQFLENDVCHVWSYLYSLLSLDWHFGSVLNSTQEMIFFLSFEEMLPFSNLQSWYDISHFVYDWFFHLDALRIFPVPNSEVSHLCALCRPTVIHCLGLLGALLIWTFMTFSPG